MNLRPYHFPLCFIYAILLLCLALKLEAPASVHLVAFASLPVLLVAAFWTNQLQVFFARYFYPAGIVWAGGCLALSFTDDSILDKWKHVSEWQGWVVYLSLVAAALLPMFFAMDRVDARWRRVLGCVVAAVVSWLVYPYTDGLANMVVVTGMVGLSIPAIFPVVQPLSHRWVTAKRPDGLPFYMVASVLRDETSIGKRAINSFFEEIQNEQLLQAIFHDKGLSGYREAALQKISDPVFHFTVLSDTSKPEELREIALNTMRKSAVMTGAATNPQDDWLSKVLKAEPGLSSDFRQKILDCITDEPLLQEIATEPELAVLHTAALQKIKAPAFHQAVFTDPVRPAEPRKISYHKLLTIDQSHLDESTVFRVFAEKQLPPTFRRELLGQIRTPANLNAVIQDEQEDALLRTMALSALKTYKDFKTAIVSLPQHEFIRHISVLKNYNVLNQYLQDKESPPPQALNDLHVAIARHLLKNGKAEMHETMFALVINLLLSDLTETDLTQTLRKYIAACGEGKGFAVSQTAHQSLAERLTGFLSGPIRRNTQRPTSEFDSHPLELLWAAGHFFSLAPHESAVGPLRNACILLQHSIRQSDDKNSFGNEVGSPVYQEEMALGGVLLGLGSSAACMMDYRNFANDEAIYSTIESLEHVVQESKQKIELLQDVFQKLLDHFPASRFRTLSRGQSDVLDIGVYLGEGLSDSPWASDSSSMRGASATNGALDAKFNHLTSDADTLYRKLTPYLNDLHRLPDPAGAAERIQIFIQRYNQLLQQFVGEQESLVNQLSAGRFLLQVLNDAQTYRSYMRQHAWSALRTMIEKSYLDDATKEKIREAVERSGESFEESGSADNIATFEVRLPQNSSPGEMMYVVNWAVGNLLALQDEQADYQDLDNILREVYGQLPDAVAFFEQYPLKLMPLPLKNQLGYYREQGFDITHWTRYTPPKDIGEVHHRFLTVSDMTRPNSMGMVYKLLRHRLTSLPVLYHEHLHYKGLKNEAEVWLREHIFLRSLIAKGAPDNPELLEPYVWESLETFFPGLQSLHPEEPVFPVNVLIPAFDPFSRVFGLVARPHPLPQDRDPFTACFLKTDLTGSTCFQALNEVITSCYGEQLNQQAATTQAERIISNLNLEIYLLNRELTWAPHIRYPRLGEPETREVTKRLHDILVQRAMQCNTLTENEFQKVLADPEVREQLMAWEHFRERAGSILNTALERFTDLEGFVGRCLKGFEKRWDYFVFKG